MELEVDEIVSAGSRSCGRGVWNMSVHRRRLCHMPVRHMVVTVGAWQAAEVQLTSKGWRCCVRRQAMNTHQREVRSWMRSTLACGWRM